MKTDSLFYKLFQQTPQLLLELAALELPGAENYQFRSEEIKQTAFRLDGVLTPPSKNPTLPLVFVSSGSWILQSVLLRNFLLSAPKPTGASVARGGDLSVTEHGSQWQAALFSATGKSASTAALSG